MVRPEPPERAVPPEFPVSDRRVLKLLRGWGNYFRTGKHGLHRLRGTVRYPGSRTKPPSDRPPASRVRKTRMHGLKGGFHPRPDGPPSGRR
jgi:hypothetical protein